MRATEELILGNKMDGNDGIDDVPHIDNEGVVMIVVDTIDPKIDDTRRVMETLP